MPIVRSGHIDVHYEDSGAGEPIVWIPGTGLLCSTWRDHQVPHFQSRHRCVALDLRGSGETHGGDDDYTVADLADDVAGLIDALGISAVHVVGVSLGSAIAQELTLRRPDLVRTAILLATWSSTTREHHLRRHFESRLYALEHGPLDVFAQFAFWMSAPSIFDHEPDLQRAVSQHLTEHTSQRFDGTASHFRADLKHETQERLPNISCPALVLYGEEDLITLPWYNETVASMMPNAVTKRIPRAGHLAWVERPEEVNRHIDAFLHSVKD